MKNLLVKIVLWFSVFTLAFELPITNIAGQGFKFWMFSVLASGLILLWDVCKDGFLKIKQSKILLFGLGFIVFSFLGLLASPEIGYSLKQIFVLASLVVLGIFWEIYGNHKNKIFYSALASGLLLSVAAALYQNIAFEFGWLHFEVMAARPNAFFPEADWLGMYFALGILPFLVALANNKFTNFSQFLRNKFVFYCFTFLIITALIITVARASWLVLLAEMGIIILISCYLKYRKNIRFSLGYKLKITSYKLLSLSLLFFSLIIIPLILISFLHLSRFNIPDRFRSIFFREHIITVAENPATGEEIKINLEEIEQYRAGGYLIKEDYIIDENVVSREEKARGAWDIIKEHLILGSGLGATMVATNYQHNANNLFLEWWVCAGLGGLALIISLMAYLLMKGFLMLKSNPQSAIIILAGTAGFIIVNLFNASIFLAFAWFYLAWLLSIVKSENRRA